MRLGLRIAVLVLGLGLGSFGLAVAQTPTVLHVTRSSVEYPSTYNLRVWGTIGTEKVELIARFSGGFASKEPGVLAPGDYPVRLESEKKTEIGITRKYDVEVMPGKHVTFTLAGLGE